MAGVGGESDRMMKLGSCVLTGHVLRLEPLRRSHREGLLEAAQSADIWAWMSMNLSRPTELDEWIERGMADEEQGLAYPFAVLEQATGRVLGSTRYLNIQPLDRGVEIGWTWYTPGVWGTSGQPRSQITIVAPCL